MKTIKVYGLTVYNDNWAVVELTTSLEEARKWEKSSNYRSYEEFELTLPIQVQSDY